MSDYIQLFKPVVKTYGFVFNFDYEPILFIINSKGKVLDGIPILDDMGMMSDEEINLYIEKNIYLYLEPNETIMVSVQVTDALLNEVDIDSIDDDNFEKYIYNLIPLKIDTLPNTAYMSKSDKPFKTALLTIMSNYKKVLKKSK